MSGAVVIGTVHPDHLDAQYTSCLAATLAEDYANTLVSRARVMLARAPAGMIHVARNEIVRAFLAHPLAPPYLLFIDTDMTWTPDQVWALVETATTQQLPALSGLIAFCQQTPDGPGPPIAMLYNTDFKLVPVSADVQRVFCAGMGFMLLRRDALQTVGAAHGWPTPWFDYGHRNGKAVSEDVIFSQRLLDLDIPVHVDTRIRLGHRKTYTFTPTTSVAEVLCV